MSDLPVSLPPSLIDSEVFYIMARGNGAVFDTNALDSYARACMAPLQERVRELERNRDLALAHDRQPYPTAWAYEQVCTALNKTQDRARELEVERDLWHKRADALEAELSRLKARETEKEPIKAPTKCSMNFGKHRREQT